MIPLRTPSQTRLKSHPVSAESSPADDLPPDPARDNSRWSGTVDLGRLAWLVTVGALVVGMIVLALRRDWGYAAVSAAVALSAAINLF